MTTALKVSRLEKRYGAAAPALKGISFEVQQGEFVALLGPNGAGKSTTIKMLTGILVPTSGHVRVCGLEPVRQRTALARRIGVVFGQRSQLWWDLPLRESFRLLAAIHRLPGEAWRSRLEECVGLLGMSSFLDTPVRQLSLGQRMRGELTAALLHSPELLVLDEPTYGQDRHGVEGLTGILDDHVERGAALVLASHDRAFVDRVATRVVRVEGGRVVDAGAPRPLAASA